VFIDDTGGFGAGWIDQLRVLGRSPIAVAFSGQAHDRLRYYNKRAEMYFDAIEWIRRGGALPESPELAAALTQTTYSFQGDRFLLEPKEDVKIKLSFSPDEADAFVLTRGHGGGAAVRLVIAPGAARNAPDSAAQNCL
jgi:phage terminase large subunit